MEKTWNNKAWFMVLPVLVLVAFSAVIPLMTVVNYSVQDTFGNNQFFWAGTEWFQEVLHLGALPQRAGAQPRLLRHHPRDRGAARHLRRAQHAEQGHRVPVCLVLMALPLLIPWNVVGTIWQVFGRADIGLLGHTLDALGIDYNYVPEPGRRLGDRRRHGRLALDEPRRAAVLCRPRLDPRRLLPGRQDRRRLALVGVPLHPAAEAAAACC